MYLTLMLINLRMRFGQIAFVLKKIVPVGFLSILVYYVFYCVWQINKIKNKTNKYRNHVPFCDVI